MPQLKAEIEANHAAFFEEWTKAACGNWLTLKAHALYKVSYRRLTAMQAIKVHLIPSYSRGSAAFFFEAHNDALVSHVSASTGAWRSALQSLRSCLENVLCAIFYNEHPIELEQWSAGEFIIGFAELLKYMERHPRLVNIDGNLTGLDIIKGEYATLSKAVHGSATNFRMTDSVSQVLLWSDDPSKASMWATREKRTIEGISCLMICLHRSALDGTKLTPLRSTLSYSLSQSKRQRIQCAIDVNIPDP